MKAILLILLGVGLLLLVKYPIVGLSAWNGFFHPGRVESANQKFMSPLMGAFKKGGCCGN